MTSGRYPAKAFAVFAILLMVLSIVIPLINHGESWADFTDDDYYVVYDPGSIGGLNTSYNENLIYEKITVKYDGVAVAEYNPQFWNKGYGDFSNSIATHAIVVGSDVVNWYAINEYKTGTSGTIVFNGWLRDGGEPLDPGDKLDESWFEDVGGKKTLTLTASWTSLVSYNEISGDIEYDDSRLKGSDPYTHIVLIRGNVRFYDFWHPDNTEPVHIGGVTLRGTSGSSINVASYYHVINWTMKDGLYIDSSVVIDNIGLNGFDTDREKHGSEYGFYAQGNKLIMGVGITGENVTIYGGGKSGTVNSSDVAIFSGNYANIYGGSYEGNVTGTTDVRIVGGTFYDTVCGGNNQRKEVSTDSTNVLIVGGSVWDGSKNTIDSYEYQTVVGGSRQSDVTESHVTIAGKAKVLAVQGGGRSGVDSRTDITQVTISGNAYVVYLVCGSVTDGNNSNNSTAPVGSSNVEIGGSSSIGSESNDAGVYAGGWDTYTASVYPSTEMTKLVIKDSCTIHGNVFGGGFRGTVGMNSSNVDYVVDIDIVGGQIFGSLYGGGSGGPDPLKHAGDSYGKAYVQGNVSILVQNTKISGSVYGGGLGVTEPDESELAKVTGNVELDIISSTIEKSVYGGGAYGKVEGSTNMSIDGTVKGSVYGGGLGVSSSGSELGKVYGPTYVTVSGEVGSGTEGDGVYGGGMYGNVVKDSIVVVTGKVSGSVYGGGNGSPGDSSLAKLGSTTVRISGTVTGSVYGGGNLAQVDSTSLTISSATIDGSVYGGGNGAGGSENSATVSRSTFVTIQNSEIGGSVYGGGSGLSSKENKVNETIATVGGSVSVTISGTSHIHGDVFGGGKYGAVGHDISDQAGISENIQMTISGVGLTVEGSVYGGGYGEEGRNSTYMNQRIITINGPSIHGSVYGGSRMGDDNTHVLEGNRVDKVPGSSYIYFVSGDLMNGTSGNIYGAGYSGHSNFDTYVYVGTEATEACGLSPVTNVLKVRSVYGGSSIGASVGGESSTELMTGDSRIFIGGTEDVYREGLSISGNVFGSGDYCEISGDSYITFDNFRQSGTMQSVQKATEVTLISSSLELLGDMDGATTTGSPRFSVNRVGMLRLDQTRSGGASAVVMHAATSQISGYVSAYEDAPDGSSEKSDYNSITMLRGMIFSVLGEGNSCMHMGEVSGVTYFENDTTYYGAFAIIGKEYMNVDGTGFVVEVDGDLRSADYNDFTYTFGEDTADVRAWFIKGAYAVEGTVIIQEDDGSDTSGKDVTIDIPKIRSTSTVAVVGYYFNAEVPGSLNIVDSLGDDSAPGNDLMVTLGATGSGISFGNGAGVNLGGNQVWPVKADTGSKGISLGINVQTKSGFTTSGYIGSITIHMAEMSGDALTDAFDMVVGVYLRMSYSDEQVIDKDIIIRDGTGSTDVYLPVLQDSQVGVYSVTGYPTVCDWRINTVPSNISKDGWLYSGWSNTAMDSGSDNKILGTGAVYAPVIRIGIDADGFDENTVYTFTIVVSEEVSGEAMLEITIHLHPIPPPEMTVSVEDTSLNIDGIGIGNPAWLGHQVVFQLKVQHGAKLDRLYVQVSTGNVENGDVVWTTFEDADGSVKDIASQSDFYKAVNQSMLKDEDGFVMTFMSQSVPDAGYQYVSLMDLMEDYFGSKPSTSYDADNDGAVDDNEAFSYTENNPGWYDSVGGYSEFNFGSLVTNDVSVYGGYAVIVNITVLKETVDENGKKVFVEDEGFYIDPRDFILGAPNSVMDLDSVDMILSEGYEVRGWYYDRGMQSPIKGDYSSYNSATIYLAVGLADYTVTIEVDGTVESVSVGKDSLESVGADDTKEYGYYNYNSGTITVVVNIDGGSHVSAAVGVLDSGGQISASFSPQLDGDGNAVEGYWVVTMEAVADNIALTIEVSDQYTVTVTLPDGADNGMFSIQSAVLEDGTLTVTLTEDEGTKAEVVQVSSGFDLEVVTAGGHKYPNEIVFSVYHDSGSVVRSKSFNIEFGEPTANLDVDVYAHIQWDVSMPDKPGYTMKIQNLDPDTGKFSEAQDYNKGDPVYTGDRIVLVCDPDHRFDTSFVAHGVSVATGAGERQYTVVGHYAIDAEEGRYGVMFGSATLQNLDVTLTVHFGLLYDAGSDRYTYPASVPAWTLQANGSAVNPIVSKEYDSSTGVCVYTFRLNPDVYTFTADFGDRYKDATVADVMVTSANSSFDLYAVPVVTGGGGAVSVGTVTIYEKPGGSDLEYTIEGTLDFEETVTIEGNEITIRVVPSGDGKSTLQISEIPAGIVGTYFLEATGLTVVVVVVPQVQGSGAQLVVPQ